ncbi:MAG: glycosyltransferase [Terracoccus sp.]
MPHTRPGSVIPTLSTASRPTPTRVLAVPSAHPYPERLRAVGPDAEHSSVVHLTDPPVAGAPNGQWWPPPALDADWVRAHADEVDVIHLHFGFDASSPDDLQGWVDALDETGIPLVLTVHDLANPHFTDQTAHLARLDVLVLAAAAVITLTEGAAAEIRERWGRDVEVVAHPHVAPIELVGAPRPGRDGVFRIGLRLAGLRANVVGEPVVRALADAVAGLPGAELVVSIQREVLSPLHPRHDRLLIETLAELVRRGRIVLDVHERLTDEQLWEHVRGLDLSVLAYAHGTHSGWVELCHDLGTTVLAPRTGHWVEQQPMLTFGWGRDGHPDAGQIFSALQLAVLDRPRWEADPAQRVAQQRSVSRRHEQLYAAVLGDVRTAGVA